MANTNADNPAQRRRITWAIVASILLYASWAGVVVYILVTMDASPTRTDALTSITSGISIFFSTVLAGGIAWFTVTYQQRIARKKHTADIMLRNITNPDMIHALKHFNTAKRSREGLEYWADNVHQNEDTATAIRTVLNDYESLAIGISEGWLDGNTYKRWGRAMLVNDYRAARVLIGILQHFDGANYFIEFQSLAQKWGQEMGIEKWLLDPIGQKDVEHVVREKNLSWRHELHTAQ